MTLQMKSVVNAISQDSNDEARMTNDKLIPKPQNDERRATTLRNTTSSFGFPSDFVIRTSSFYLDLLKTRTNCV
jgi:hypothetical protein